MVLNQAEESAYDDQEWHLYHFPRTYRSNIERGSRFVYYRTGDHCYFGMGRIGRVWPDPHRCDHWYAELAGARKFPRPVFYQDRLGRYLERRPEIRRPAFQRSARWIDREVYDRILYGSWLWAVVINGEAFRRELAGGSQRAAALAWVRRQKAVLSEVRDRVREVYDCRPGCADGIRHHSIRATDRPLSPRER